MTNNEGFAIGCSHWWMWNDTGRIWCTKCGEIKGKPETASFPPMTQERTEEMIKWIEERLEEVQKRLEEEK